VSDRATPILTSSVVRQTMAPAPQASRPLETLVRPWVWPLAHWSAWAGV